MSGAGFVGLIDYIEKKIQFTLFFYDDYFLREFDLIS